MKTTPLGYSLASPSTDSPRALPGVAAAAAPLSRRNPWEGGGSRGGGEA